MFYEEKHNIVFVIHSPNILRVDTYDPPTYLIDITLEIPGGDFNMTSDKPRLLAELRALLAPWFPKTESITLDRDKYYILY